MLFDFVHGHTFPDKYYFYTKVILSQALPFVKSVPLLRKVALFATLLGRRTYEYICPSTKLRTGPMRASVPGDFNVIPTHAEEMYFRT
jgi:hypothetical protein